MTLWKVYQDGTAICAGIDYGNGQKPIVVWHRDARHIVFKIPGGKHWVGRMLGWESHPGVFIVGIIERCTPENGFELVKVSHLFEMSLSKKQAIAT